MYSTLLSYHHRKFDNFYSIICSLTVLDTFFVEHYIYVLSNVSFEKIFFTSFVNILWNKVHLCNHSLLTNYISLRLNDDWRYGSVGFLDIRYVSGNPEVKVISGPVLCDGRTDGLMDWRTRWFLETAAPKNGFNYITKTAKTIKSNYVFF